MKGIGLTNNLPQSTMAGLASANVEALPKRLRTLVVEDDLTCRLLLHGLLTHYGDCDIALDGVEAVKMFQASLQNDEPYDLVCMDIQMPEMDGQEAVTRIREMEKARNQDSEVKILMTTSLTDLKTIFQSFGARCDDYLVKPVDGMKLEQHLKAFGLIA